MCYGSKPVINAKGGVDWIPNDEFNRMYKDGEIVVRRDGYHYAKDTVAAFRWRGGRIEVVPMRWDLVPRNFLLAKQGKGARVPEASLAEAVRAKNSRATGFSSYNARVETVARLLSFQKPWEEGLRMAMPAEAFKERPNMEGAPAESKGREYEVLLDGTYYLAGIYDLWRNGSGESLESCSILTMDSAGNEKIRAIWHERTPIVLEEAQLEEWLDPLTPPERARQMCRLLPADRMEIREVPREARKREPPKASGDPEQLELL